MTFSKYIRNFKFSWLRPRIWYVQLCNGFTLCYCFICFIYVSYKIVVSFDFYFYHLIINKDIIHIKIRFNNNNIIMIVIHYYLDRENYKVLKFHLINSSYFEIGASLFWAPTLKILKLSKCLGHLVFVTTFVCSKTCFVVIDSYRDDFGLKDFVIDNILADWFIICY